MTETVHAFVYLVHNPQRQREVASMNVSKVPKELKLRVLMAQSVKMPTTGTLVSI